MNEIRNKLAKIQYELIFSEKLLCTKAQIDLVRSRFEYLSDSQIANALTCGDEIVAENLNTEFAQLVKELSNFLCELESKPMGQILPLVPDLVAILQTVDAIGRLLKLESCVSVGPVFNSAICTQSTSV